MFDDDNTVDKKASTAICRCFLIPSFKGVGVVRGSHFHGFSYIIE